MKRRSGKGKRGKGRDENDRGYEGKGRGGKSLELVTYIVFQIASFITISVQHFLIKSDLQYRLITNFIFGSLFP